MDERPQSHLIIEGARQHNLKDVNVAIPHDALTVVTGVSGSGKSSLAFDTLFAEGQWRYIESLSSYTRMFLERVTRPDLDAMHHVRPAIALQQSNPVRTSRSTVGTASEIYDYLRLLFAKVGHVVCPDCEVAAAAHSPESVSDTLLTEFPDQRALIMFPMATSSTPPTRDAVSSLLKQGFVRVLHGTTTINLERDPLPTSLSGSLYVIVDRLVVRSDNRARLSEGLETAFHEGCGTAAVHIDRQSTITFHNDLHCPSCHRTFESVRPVHFSFNHPLGACPDCKGFGNILRYDEALIIPDPTKPVKDGAIEPWTKPSNRWWQEQMLKGMKRRKLSIDTPYHKLSEAERRLLWEGEGRLEGIHDFFQYLEGKRYKLHVRVFLSRYRSPLSCPACHGRRLRPPALMVRLDGHTIHEIVQWPLHRVHDWITRCTHSMRGSDVARDLLHTIGAKLQVLLDVGVGYLTLHREMRTLSGGEAQRVALANQLGAALVGTLYVLDEPTIGLHPRDTTALVTLLRTLAHRGNTVVVVEHDHSVITQADHVIEMGPGAGEHGGCVLCSAPYTTFRHSSDSLTNRYLSGDRSIPLPTGRRSDHEATLTLTGARAHNLKNLTVRIPLGTLTCITGVSGSGKSTLVDNLLYPALARALRLANPPVGPYDALTGVEQVDGVRLINQEPIGKTPRSNPVTYVKAFDAIRRLFAQSPEAVSRGLAPAHFSFNTGRGRCPRCEGQGQEQLDMYFFDDLYVTCEMCDGRRFTPEVLSIRILEHTIHDVLQLTVDDALARFGPVAPRLQKPLALLSELGLGYLRLGQPATSLSGGESQRLKIASELAKLPSSPRTTARPPHTVYILDEPTTGLHIDDVAKLIPVFHRLVDAGHTVIVVEHHLDVMKCADWIIDLGPEGGERGGHIVAEGPPETIAATANSATGRYLRPLLGEAS